MVGLLAGCNDQYHDPSLKLSKDRYEKILTGREEVEPSPAAPPAAMPKKPVLPNSMQRKISITMTADVPLREVLMELARQAKVNIAIDPSVKGGLHFQAHGRPFIEIVETICDMAQLKFFVNGSTINIAPDAPYPVNYNVQFLNLSRHNKNRISMATDVFTAMEGYTRDFDNGSSTLLTEESSINFWDELEQNLKNLANYSNQNADEAPISYSIHRQAGVVSAYALQKHHKQIAKYLDSVMENAQLQVLIEAKIIEVNLSEEFQSGINWNAVAGDFKLRAPLGAIASAGLFDKKEAAPNNVFTIGNKGKSLTALASVLNKFGTVRTLSSPRLTVMNNQSAVLKVATNFVFFKINYSRDIRTNDLPDVERASSQIQTVPIGLVMVVHPTINPDTGRITMTLRPTISRVVEEKEDPAVAILSRRRQSSKIPEVQVREIDSVLQVSSGEVVIMGGLMEDRADNSSTGLPGISDIPLAKYLLGAKENKHTINELVIFLRATIVDNPVIGDADKNVYRYFTQDSRPWRL